MPATTPTEYWPSIFGDSRNSGFTPHETKIDSKSVRSLEPVWSKRQAGLPYDETPLVVGRRVFASCGDEDLCAFSLSTGRRLWQVPGTAVARPAAAGGMVFAAVQFHPLRFVALRADTGEEVWSRTFPDASQTADWAKVHNGLVYMGDTDGNLYALDAATGATRWSRAVGVAWVPAFAGNSMFAVVSGLGRPPHMRVFNPETGHQKWAARFYPGMSATPVVGGGRVYVRSSNGDVAAFDVDDCGTSLCDPLWHVPEVLPPGRGPAVAGGVLYFIGGGDSSLRALRARDGKQLWSSAPIGAEIDYPPTVANGVVYVASEDRLRAFRATGCGAAQCRPLWAQRTADYRSWGSSAAVIADGRLLVAAGNTLYRFSLPSPSRPDPRPPAAPTAVSATAYDAEASLEWVRPTDTGGFPVIGHRIRVSDGRIIWTRSGAAGYPVKGLTNGTSYTFKVAAITVAGIGPESEASNTVRPDLRHTAPTDVNAEAGAGEATVTWTGSPHNFGDDTLEYWVTAYRSDGTSFLADIVTNKTSVTLSPLSPDRYTFTVVTVAHSTSSDPSAPSDTVHVTAP